MRAHVFRGRFAPLVLDGFVRDFDLRTREEGFHVLHSWNHLEHHFTRENTPVLMLDRFAKEWSAARATPRVQALLLDHYFFYVLAVMVMRAWDEGDPNEQPGPHHRAAPPPAGSRTGADTSSWPVPRPCC